MRVSHPIFARFYERLSRLMEPEVGRHREELVAGLSGRVIEVGAGNGMNFPHYPPEVTEVLAVEPEPRLRAAALKQAGSLRLPIRVVEGVAETLPADDDSFHAAVASLMLCSVSDQRQALAELFRVLRPSGELRFYEHVRSRHPRLARAQQAADLIWPFFTGGCHTSRDTLAGIEGAGFDLEWVRRFRFPVSRLFIPSSPHVLGVARKPG
ncbi:MAG: class I SAM-dependent methyltransferase [Actinomycetota bacterium]|nr:class I SAM-dependent methyltransferase [Actinomycetota bacterium]